MAHERVRTRRHQFVCGWAPRSARGRSSWRCADDKRAKEQTEDRNGKPGQLPGKWGRRFRGIDAEGEERQQEQRKIASPAKQRVAGDGKLFRDGSARSVAFSHARAFYTE